MTEATQTAVESPEEKFVREEVEKSDFQRELDQAIEEKRLTDVVENLYKLDASEFIFKTEVRGVDYFHKFKAPTDHDELRKDAMSVTIIRNAGRFQGDDMVEQTTDNANALRRYYDALALEVRGYPITEDADPDQWVPVSTVVDEATEDSDAKTLLEYIPDSDKIKAAIQIHNGSAYVITEKGKRIRSIKARREYIVKQLFGVERDEDGILSKPKHVIAYHFVEGTARDIGFFDTRCYSRKTLIKKEGNPESRQTISVTEASALFDRLINYMQGASINGEEVRSIAEGDQRLKQIPSRLKTDAVFVYMNFLKS